MGFFQKSIFSGISNKQYAFWNTQKAELPDIISRISNKQYAFWNYKVNGFFQKSTFCRILMTYRPHEIQEQLT